MRLKGEDEESGAASVFDFEVFEEGELLA